MIQLRLLPLLVVLSCASSLSAQKYSRFPADPNAPFDPYFVETIDTSSNSGPHTITRNILQDKKGNYWLTTWQGIMHYDGTKFTNVTLKEGLLHFHVNSMFEDKAGNIWFGTVRGGVYKYDGNTFKLFTKKDGLADNNVDCFLQDRNGNIWMGGDSGVTRYDGTGFTRFNRNDGPGNRIVSSIIQDKNGRLWFGANDGLYTFEGNTFSRVFSKGTLPFKMVWALAEDDNGTILIGGPDGLYRYDGTSFANLRTEPITFIYRNKAGEMWFSVSETNPESKWQIGKFYQSLYRYDGSSFTKVTDRNYANDFQVFGIMQDKAGDIWFGTMKGVCRYDGKTVKSFTN